MGEFSKAIACFSSVLEDDPQFEDAIECRIASYIGIGRGEDALRDLDRLPPSNTNLARRVCAYAVSGDKTAAENALENLLTVRKDGHVAPDFLAAAFLLLDRQEEALLALQQGIDDRETGVLVFRTWPMVSQRNKTPAINQLLDRAEQAFRRSQHISAERTATTATA